MSNNTNKTVSFVSRQKNLIIALAIIFAILLVGYFTVIAPLMKDEVLPSDGGENVETLPGEVLLGNRIYIYERLERGDVDKVVFHNPNNREHGEKYVDWGFSIKLEKSESTGKINANLYLDGYEYAPTDSTAESHLVSGVTEMLVTSRVEKHATDLAKYGLEKADGNHDDECVYYVLTTTKGKEYKLYVGDKIPSGAGYYVKSGDTVKDENGNEYVRDSVYIISASTVENAALSSPVEVVQPILGYPLQMTTNAIFDNFALSSRDGRLDLLFRPVPSANKDAFGVFAALSVYEALVPAGYYASAPFESLAELFSEFNGYEVVELASLMKMKDEYTGEEYDDYYFPEEVFAKYGLTEPQYSLFYSNSGFDSAMYFSEIQKDGYYYAYSLVFNTIVRVLPETLTFLTWEENKYIQSEIFQLGIDDCAGIKVSGTLGDQKIEESFELNGKGKDLKVNCSTGSISDIANFRNYYIVLLQTCIQDQVPSELDKEEIMKNGPVLTFEITTNEKIVYKLDEDGNSTSKLDYVLAPVKRVFRFYQYTNGRLLCTIESIDSEGVSSGESGDFYVRSFKVEKILSDTLKVRDGLEVDRRERE